MPIYSIDGRNGPISRAPHWSHDSLGERAHFDLNSRPPGLLLRSLNATDHALYRCRVDFQSSPTRNIRVQLDIIVPPKRIRVLNEEGLEVSGVIGPYPVGASLTLYCQVKTGKPRPNVWWIYDSRVIDDSVEMRVGETTSNTLTLPHLTRHNLYSVITCQSSNSNLSLPISASVTLDMSFPPLDVRILGNVFSLVEGERYSLVCESTGSRPSASMTWWKDGIMMTDTRTQVYNEGNVSRSTFYLSPSLADHNTYVSCRAKNPLVPTAVLEDSKKLNILYRPRLSLAPGDSLDMADIKEGDDVYFQCGIHANPSIYRLHWYHNGVELYHNVSGGVIESNQSLVLQEVKRESSGLYKCSATNQHGTSYSNAVQLSVKYAPVCRSGQQMVYGGGKHQEFNITCSVHSYPEPTSFRWAFNSSSEIVDLPSSKFQVIGKGKSQATYIPKTHLDYGSLLCWANNDVGRQHEPCVYHVIHAASPDPVTNCSISNVTSKSLYIACLAGWDGGLPQTFTLSVSPSSTSPTSSSSSPSPSSSSSSSPRVLANTSTSPKPQFLLSGLQPATRYVVSIAGVNKKGHSLPVRMVIFTLNDTTPILHIQGPASPVMSLGVGLCVGVGVSLVVMGVVIMTLVMKCQPTSDTQKVIYEANGVTESEAINLKSLNNLSASDHNPDVIPISNDHQVTEQEVANINTSQLPPTYLTPNTSQLQPTHLIHSTFQHPPPTSVPQPTFHPPSILKHNTQPTLSQHFPPNQPTLSQHFPPNQPTFPPTHLSQPTLQHPLRTSPRHHNPPANLNQPNLFNHIGRSLTKGEGAKLGGLLNKRPECSGFSTEPLIQGAPKPAVEGPEKGGTVQNNMNKNTSLLTSQLTKNTNSSQLPKYVPENASQLANLSSLSPNSQLPHDTNSSQLTHSPNSSQLPKYVPENASQLANLSSLSPNFQLTHDTNSSQLTHSPNSSQLPKYVPQNASQLANLSSLSPNSQLPTHSSLDPNSLLPKNTNSSQLHKYTPENASQLPNLSSLSPNSQLTHNTNSSQLTHNPNSSQLPKNTNSSQLPKYIPENASQLPNLSSLNPNSLLPNPYSNPTTLNIASQLPTHSSPNPDSQPPTPYSNTTETPNYTPKFSSQLPTHPTTPRYTPQITSQLPTSSHPSSQLPTPSPIPPDYDLQLPTPKYSSLLYEIHTPLSTPQKFNPTVTLNPQTLSTSDPHEVQNPHSFSTEPTIPQNTPLSTPKLHPNVTPNFTPQISSTSDPHEVQNPHSFSTEPTIPQNTPLSTPKLHPNVTPNFTPPISSTSDPHEIQNPHSLSTEHTIPQNLPLFAPKLPPNFTPSTSSTSDPHEIQTPHSLSTEHTIPQNLPLSTPKIHPTITQNSPPSSTSIPHPHETSLKKSEVHETAPHSGELQDVGYSPPDPPPKVEDELGATSGISGPSGIPGSANSPDSSYSEKLSSVPVSSSQLESSV